MDVNLKQKALRNLAKIEGESAQEAIHKELDKIRALLENETLYDLLKDQITLIDTIAYRAHEKAFSILSNFLIRLDNIKITYGESPYFSLERQLKYANAGTITVQVLEVLEHIRYHEPSDILNMFFEYSNNQDEAISKKALQGIKQFAGYDLDLFYSDGKEWQGLGAQPQEKILEKISSLDDKDKAGKYFSATISAYQEVLSPEITGTSSTYKTFTWRTGAVPAIDSVKEVRNTAIDGLKKLYALVVHVDRKKEVLNALESATRLPHADHDDQVLEMVKENTISVSRFLREIANTGEMELRQKIEHDAYWMLYHRGSLDENIKSNLIAIRDELYADEEYTKFRILIGFESIYHEWETGEDKFDHQKESEYRESEALKLAESINANSYDEWKERIVLYAAIESNDLATFPYFGKFLEHFGQTAPDLAAKLLSESADQLERFMNALLVGISKSCNEYLAIELIEAWCNEGKYLYRLARHFEFTAELNEDVFRKIMNKAIADTDISTLNQIVSTTLAKTTFNDSSLIHNFLLPTLESLTKLKRSDWIFGVWFRNQTAELLSEIDDDVKQAILRNLYWLPKIDYQAEELLCALAKNNPDFVLKFFCDRLQREKEQDADWNDFEAVPFDFHKLSDPLSKYPELAINAVKEIDDGNYGMFVFRGARLLKNIFPSYPPEFQNLLEKQVENGKEEDLRFVLAILRNYDGASVIIETCRKIAKALNQEDRLRNELIIVLQSTGVVSGEYGRAEAYKEKVEDIQQWLEDDDPKVIEFAKAYIEDLEHSIEVETKRADEDIALRKHQYGSDEN